MAMPLTTSVGASFSVVLPDELATYRLMIDIASALEPGDMITLSPPRTTELPAEKEDEKPTDAPAAPASKNILAEARKKVNPS